MSLESYQIIENVYVWNIVLLVIYWMITISYVEEIEEMSVQLLEQPEHPVSICVMYAIIINVIGNMGGIVF